MKVAFSETYIGDFETTVYENQTETEVWASGLVKMWTEDVIIHHSIDETFDFLCSLKKNVIIYYHNLKFDGAFWLSFLMRKTSLKPALTQVGSDPTNVKFPKPEDLPKNTYKYSISLMGQWYSIDINYNGHIIEIRDSLKLLPFSVKKIGKDFETKHQKLEMEYEGERFAGCEITEDERRYLANDLLVVKEALEIMYKEGHKKLTIGSCCLEEFRTTFNFKTRAVISQKKLYQLYFPDLSKIALYEDKYGAPNVDRYIRNSYRGGWCYLVKGKECKIKHNGTTADVNSLYPSMMSSESGNKFPCGKPVFWKGNFIPDIAKDSKHYYFLRIRTRFKIKHNMLPCIQIKHNLLYPSKEWLVTSDIYNEKDGKYYSKYIHNGEVKEAYVTLTLTETDYALIQDHYDLIDCEILDGCYFNAKVGLFDTYIDKYKKIKLESTGAKKQLAKLFLNSLYGKYATSDDSSFKVGVLKDDVVKFDNIVQHDKKVVYIPIGSAITSYARNFTIRAAQMNYYGVNKKGFIYADTDSIHCDLPPEKIKGIKVDDKNFCCWKLEAQWDIGWFVRQKTYIEHVTHENLKHVPKAYYNIKCAGMPDRCKKLFEWSMLGRTKEDWINNHKKEWFSMHELEQQFVLEKRSVTDFKVGITVLGKLTPRTIKGGVVLGATTFKMR